MWHGMVYHGMEAQGATGRTASQSCRGRVGCGDGMGWDGMIWYVIVWYIAARHGSVQVITKRCSKVALQKELHPLPSCMPPSLSHPVLCPFLRFTTPDGVPRTCRIVLHYAVSWRDASHVTMLRRAVRSTPRYFPLSRTISPLKTPSPGEYGSEKKIVKAMT